MHRHTSAKQRRHFNRRKPVGNLQGVARRGFQKLCEATVHGHSGNLLPQTKVFIAFLAEGALAASPVNPGYAGAVTNLQIANGGASPDNATGNLVAEDLPAGPLGLRTLEKERHRAAHPFAQTMGPGEIDRPAPHNRGVKPFEKLRHMSRRKLLR